MCQKCSRMHGSSETESEYICVRMCAECREQRAQDVAKYQNHIKWFLMITILLLLFLLRFFPFALPSGNMWPEFKQNYSVFFFAFRSFFPLSLSHTRSLAHFPPISHGCVAVVSSQIQTNVKESSSETKFKIKTFYLVSTHNFSKLLMHCNLVSDASTIILSRSVCVFAMYMFKFHDLFFWCVSRQFFSYWSCFHFVNSKLSITALNLLWGF